MSQFDQAQDQLDLCRRPYEFEQWAIDWGQKLLDYCHEKSDQEKPDADSHQEA